MGLVNVEAFVATLSSIGDRVPAEAVSTVQRAAALEGLRALVLSTPRDEGDAVRGWEVTIDTIPSRAASVQNPIAVGAATIASAPAFSRIRVTNNVAHIEILENGGFMPPDPGPSSDPRPLRKGRILVSGGYSRQAPNGMLRIAVERVRLAIEGLGDV